MNTEEAANLRMVRIKRSLELDLLVTLEDIHFLVERLANVEHMLTAQQDAVNDAARRWREIGYEDGYSAGYHAAQTAMQS